MASFSSRKGVLWGVLALVGVGVFATSALRARAQGLLPMTDWARYSVLTPSGPDEPSPEMFRRISRLVYAIHKVRRGESNVSSMAKAYGTSVMSLQATNNDELFILRPGQKVVIPNKDGKLYEVRKPVETLGTIVRRFHGGSGTGVQHYKEAVVMANNLPGSALLNDFEFHEGDRVLLPNYKVSFDTFHFPFKGYGWPRISSGFGLRYHPILHRKKFHDGFDIPKPYGTSVYPARSGIVAQVGWSEGYGQLIIIRHVDGQTTRYGHLSKILVSVGQVVQRGKTLIGRVGSTGLSTGPHLHFEIRDRNGHPVNPGSKIGRR